MSGADDTEVPPIEGGDLLFVQTLGDSDDRRVDETKVEVIVRPAKFGDPLIINFAKFFDVNRAVYYVFQEGLMYIAMQVLPNKVIDLGENRSRHDERANVLSQ